MCIVSVKETYIVLDVEKLENGKLGIVLRDANKEEYKSANIKLKIIEDLMCDFEFWINGSVYYGITETDSESKMKFLDNTISKHFLMEKLDVLGMKLVKNNIVGNNADCWFENSKNTAHRCVSLEELRILNY